MNFGNLSGLKNRVGHAAERGSYVEGKDEASLLSAVRFSCVVCRLHIATGLPIYDTDSVSRQFVVSAEWPGG